MGTNLQKTVQSKCVDALKSEPVFCTKKQKTTYKTNFQANSKLSSFPPSFKHGFYDQFNKHSSLLEFHGKNSQNASQIQNFKIFCSYSFQKMAEGRDGRSKRKKRNRIWWENHPTNQINTPPNLFGSPGTKIIYNQHQLPHGWTWNHPFPSIRPVQPTKQMKTITC